MNKPLDIKKYKFDYDILYDYGLVVTKLRKQIDAKDGQFKDPADSKKEAVFPPKARKGMKNSRGFNQLSDAEILERE